MKQICLECTDAGGRLAGARLILVAVKLCFGDGVELKKKEAWISGWNKVVNANLMGWSNRETSKVLSTDLGEAGTGVGGVAGAIVLELNRLVNICALQWRSAGELIWLVRELGQLNEDFREMMFACHMHIRLACLILRRNAPEHLQSAYPTCCLSTSCTELVRGNCNNNNNGVGK